jgi:ferredoxin
MLGGAPARAVAYLSAVEVRVRFSPVGRALRVPAGTTLLEAARRAGLPIASACAADGLCARCGLRVLAGAEGLPPESAAERDAKQRNRIEPELRLACRVALRTDVEVTASYW